uniref:uncharacterized protein LOC113475740 n=1 Tax=Ciona intestinalis TaxID=7719 RepID=UPI000EF4FDF1|nr:uncharacterized protein LOC113475740 [Ciona intestinalis]|eukprot:XP_026696223.1 uncharacterized protein LOC113475740 [Ciona intestinalis]
MTHFISRYDKTCTFTGGTNKTLKEVKFGIESLKGKLKNRQGMGNYDAAIANDLSEKLEGLEATLNPDYLMSVFDRLKHIVPDLCPESEATEQLVSLLGSLQEKQPNIKPNNEASIAATENPVGEIVNIMNEEDHKNPTTVTYLQKLNDPISKLIKQLDSKDDQSQLRSSWAKYMMPTFTRISGQLWQVVLAREMAKLREFSKHFSLHLVRRKWVHQSERIYNQSPDPYSFYFWNGDNITKDPYYTANETHIPCKQT